MEREPKYDPAIHGGSIKRILAVDPMSFGFHNSNFLHSQKDGEGFIYVILVKNIIIHGVYIGQSTNINKRWARHKSELSKNKHENRFLQRTYNKYSSSSFYYFLIDKASIEGLTSLEQQYIDAFKKMNIRVYNIAPAGVPPKVYGKRSKETCERISLATKGKHIGRKHTLETCLKMSMTRTGKTIPGRKKLSEEQRASLSKKISISLIGNKRSLGRKQSDEVRAKISEASRNMWIKRKQKLQDTSVLIREA